MTDRVVVVGAGYAGTGTVQAVADAATARGVDVDLVWISDRDYHLVLHEVHRVVRDPEVASKVAIPIEDVRPPMADFRQSRVVDVDTEARHVELEDGETVDYDYLLVGLGSRTAFYGIPGLETHAHTLKSLDDARGIHEAVAEAGRAGTRTDPAKVVVGGAGLSGIQVAGEVAAYRDEKRAPIDVTLVEGLDEVFPGNDPSVQDALRNLLADADVAIRTGSFVSQVTDETVHLGGGEDESPEELPYDVLVWTGGITGPDAVAGANVERDERTDRVYAESTFRTSDARVFAIGDTALVEQGGSEVAPPTAQAAWQAAAVAGENLVRAVEDRPLRTWQFRDKGTLVSVGHRAVAHDVAGIPVRTFGGLPAVFLKKVVATRWIASISSVGRALRAWRDM